MSTSSRDLGLNPNILSSSSLERKCTKLKTTSQSFISVKWFLIKMHGGYQEAQMVYWTLFLSLTVRDRIINVQTHSLNWKKSEESFSNREIQSLLRSFLIQEPECWLKGKAHAPLSAKKRILFAICPPRRPSKNKHLCYIGNVRGDLCGPRFVSVAYLMPHCTTPRKVKWKHASSCRRPFFLPIKRTSATNQTPG